jgi:hypothetical protein
MLSEPLPAKTPGTGARILILGFLPDKTVVFVEADGTLQFSDDEWIETDWRYDAENDHWIDVTLITTEPIASDGE